MKRVKTFRAAIVCVAFAMAGSAAHLFGATQQPAPVDDLLARYAKSDVMIPMRDGLRLHTEIYTPRDAAGPLPFLLTRTPYGLGDTGDAPTPLFRLYREMLAEGYIFVFQDIRGRYKSEGQFVMQRPPRDPADARGIDEATDTYDTIDWLLKNVPNNNGRAGMAGISYGGWLTAMALLLPHPALRAVSEQASPADMFLGDDFHHNGAFRLSYGFEYAAELETGKTNYYFHFDRYDTYQWYLALGPLSNADRLYFHGALPTWEDFVNHPNYDEFWQKQAFARYLRNLKPTVPNLNVAGWWDQEDFYGPMKIYELMEPHDTDHRNFIVAGPWNHGGWARSTNGSALGPIQFGEDASQYFKEKIQAPWFAYWLKDKGTLPVGEALMFETGSNRWVPYDRWPPQQGVAPRKLYFHAGGKLSFDAPAETSADAFDSYISDPAHPVPYRHRPVEQTYAPTGLSRWYTWLVEDQRFVENRPDVLSWESEPLAEDVTIAGNVVAHLFASTTGTDSDWVVKLIDVYPEDFPQDPKMGGYELMISDEILRGRFRNSFEKPEPVVAGEVTPYTIDLHTASHAFLKGHRIMVQVQSTWFPLYDRNPQKFVSNIFKAAASDYQKATQSVYRSQRFASNVEIPVVTH